MELLIGGAGLRAGVIGRVGLDDRYEPSLTLAGVTETLSTKAVVASAPTWALKPCTAVRPLCLTQRPSPSVSLAEAMIVASTRLPVLTVIDLAFSSAVTVSNNVRSKPCVIRARRKRTNAVRSGVASLLEKPQKRRNDARSSSASASLTSERSYQTASSSALNIASGGQAGSPLLAG